MKKKYRVKTFSTFFSFYFYKKKGGIKAVVWTDVVQTIVMLLSMIAIVIKGTIDVSGLQTVWDRNYDSGRLDIPEYENWNLFFESLVRWIIQKQNSRFTSDLTERYSVLSLLIGGVPVCIYTSSMSQAMLQRYVSLPTIKAANKALYIFIILISIFILLCCYNGLLVHAWYAGCDPIKTKVCLPYLNCLNFFKKISFQLINAPDQLIPLLMMSVLAEFPGAPGLFIAGIFSASLSSLSTCLNAMAVLSISSFLYCYGIMWSWM